MNPSTIQADFDRLAQFDRGGWNHNSHYHAYLLRHIPEHCQNALDIGCGTGAFSRLLATRAQHVLALDLSPEMLKLARSRSQTHPNITYQLADVLTYTLPNHHFDIIVSIATLHHLPLQPFLPKIIAALKPGGIFLNLDLFRTETPLDGLMNLLAFPLHLALKTWHHKTAAHDSPEARAAWEAHGKHDIYPRVSEIQGLCSTQLPGVQIRKHLLWRYSLVWRKPVS